MVSGGYDPTRYGPLPVWPKFGGFGPRIDYIVVCVNPERVTWLRGPKPPNLAQTGSGP